MQAVQQAGSIKVGNYILIKGFPCKVTEYARKNKVVIAGLDIFTNTRHEDVFPVTAMVSVPIITYN